MPLYLFQRNVVHGSDKLETAKNEIALWFTEEELMKWEDHSDFWMYEQPGKF